MRRLWQRLPKPEPEDDEDKATIIARIRMNLLALGFVEALEMTDAEIETGVVEFLRLIRASKVTMEQAAVGMMTALRANESE